MVVFFLFMMMPRVMGTDYDLAILWVEYKKWIVSFLTGDLGMSSYYRVPVSMILREKMTNTLVLGIVSLLITYVLSFFMGRYAGRNPNTMGDRLISGLNYTGLSLPLIVVSVYSIYFFSFELNWFPSNGSVDITVPEGTWEYWLDRVHHLILPATVLGIVGTATYTQFLRDDIVENSRKEFVRTAKSIGLSEKRIYNVHILKNSLIPIVTFLGIDLVNIVNGAIIVETIFTYPGIGQLFIKSINMRDHAMVMNLTMMFSTIMIIGNMISDILYGMVDPRIKLE
ncbi:oligopeptide transport system permease protein OppB [Mesobacillus selenatarsenatis SF-1]|uniref:Oligopeptide transport system permease protein OppB n=2 Tax=Mesobacillus selenatarsenatis TaxID=388741 RepID=A0A0A8X2S1_MESS1|nr:oligopeptide transport system permease protein OppB [Mesobacillus selenatarsenatis SF-1]